MENIAQLLKISQLRSSGMNTKQVAEKIGLDLDDVELAFRTLNLKKRVRANVKKPASELTKMEYAMIELTKVMYSEINEYAEVDDFFSEVFSTACSLFEGSDDEWEDKILE